MKIFLSVPFSSRVSDDGQVEKLYRSHISELIKALTSAGHTVFCALEYTGWNINGAKSPEAEFRKDLDEISQCEKMIVLLEERISSGVQLEIGYAYAKNTHIEIYQIGQPSWSNAAFAKLSGNVLYEVSDIETFAKLAVANNL